MALCRFLAHLVAALQTIAPAIGADVEALLLGLAYWTSGAREAAYRSFADGLDHLRIAGNIADAIGGSIVLADIRVTRGEILLIATTLLL